MPLPGEVADDASSLASDVGQLKKDQFFYGGQAVIEGVMMRGKRHYAVAIRHPKTKEIVVDRGELKAAIYVNPMWKLPILRGLALIGEQLHLGMKTLMWSANMNAGGKDIVIGKREITGSIAFAAIFGLGLFFGLPLLLAGLAVHRSRSLIDRLEAIARRYHEIESEMARPEVASDHAQLTKLAREQRTLRETVEKYQAYKRARHELESAHEMLRHEKDPEMLEYLRAEERRAAAQVGELDEQLKVLLLPKDPNDDRDVVVEIQGAEGGEEAALFAADLFRMYSKWAERKGWRIEVVDVSHSEKGGYDKIVFEVHGHGAYSQLKYEGGVHRVQRVPKTEAQGRIHTSAATVSVMPEADPVEVELKPEDLEIKTSPSQGPGGQSVNPPYSAFRITHKPPGMMVSIQDEKSQLQNKEKALRVLRARLYEIKLAEQQAALGAQRRSMIGGGNRSEKIRTYNFKANRVTDHRISLDLHRLDQVMAGDLDELVEALINAVRAAGLNGT